MASSGSFTTSKYDGRGLKFSWSIQSQSVSGNYTTISWTFKGTGTGSASWYYTQNGYLKINGSKVFTQDGQKKLYDGTTLASGTTKIYHNSDGTKTFSANGGAGIYVHSVNCTGSGSWTLTAIPRYFTKTPTLTLVSKTETSMTYNWATSERCSALSWNGGGSMSGFSAGTSGTITISGLTAGNTYNHYGTFTRSDSGLTSNSAVKSNATYSYPYANNTNITIGTETSLSVYNPLSRSVTVYLLDANDTSKSLGTTTGTSLTIPNTSEWSNFWYSSIPNAKSGTYKVRLVCSAVSRDTTVSNGTYSVIGTETPTFSNFTYKDNNASVVAVTGSDQVIVKGKSSLQVIVSSANKMVAKNYATASKYISTMDTLSATVNYSSSDVTMTLGTPATAGTPRLNVTAYDSRSLTKIVYKDITVYDYAKPVVNATVTRRNNFENETTISVNGTYTRLTVGGTDKNTITAVQFRYRETGGSWSSWTNLTVTTNAGNYTCTNYAVSLDNTKSFDVEIKATDRLDNNSATKSVATGKAIFVISSNKETCYMNDEEIAVKDDVRGMKYYIELEDGTDLNTILDYGTYRSTTTAHTGTMINKPSSVTSGFTLYVTTWTWVTNSNTYRRQEIVNGYNTYVRHTNNAGSTWSAWSKVVMDTDLTHNVLWTGAYYMNETQSISLSGDNAITNQKNGWLLIFTGYKNGSVQSYNVSSFFISKKEVELTNAYGHFFPLGGNAGVSGFKYIYISTTTISGNSVNDDVTGSYKNNEFVLRYVLGV